MAQFSHAGFGGISQRSPGMTMAGDMFNAPRKAKLRRFVQSDDRQPTVIVATVSAVMVTCTEVTDTTAVIAAGRDLATSEARRREPAGEDQPTRRFSAEVFPFLVSSS